MGKATGEHKERFKHVLRLITQGLFEWQRLWLRDRSKWRVALKARQLGYTTVCELDALLQCLETPGLDYYIVSTTVGNAAKILRRIRQRWIPALAKSGHPALKLLKESDDCLELANGSRLFAIANEPDRMRGNPGSYFFDEFGFWEQRKLLEIQSAVWPSIENPLLPHLRCTVVSTPMFKDVLYYELCKSPMYDYFSRHEIDIYQAVKMGLAFDIEGVKRRITSDRWHREYCCGFVEGGSTYFNRDQLLLLAETADLDTSKASIVLGVDLGKINDFTAIVVLARTAGVCKVLHTYLIRSVDYGKQAKIIDELAEAWRAEVVAVDITKHASFVDQSPARLKRRCIAKNFTWDWKAEWVPRVKKAVEGKTLLADWEASSLWDAQRNAFTPTPSRVLLDDFTRVVQAQTPSGKVKFEVPRIKIRGAEQDGHGDGFSGLLLAYWAACNDDQEAIAEQLDIDGLEDLDDFDIADVW